ncbi:MAG: DinB family protein [Chloroflexota bacterium]
MAPESPQMVGDMTPLQQPDLIKRARDYCTHQAGKGIDSLAKLMERTGEDWQKCLDGMSEAQASFAPPGEWSSKEVVAHFLTATTGVNNNIDKLTRGESPGPLTEPTEKPKVATSVHQLQEATSAIFGETAELTRALEGNPNVAKQFAHPAFGQLDILQWIAFQRLHGMDHMQQIEKNKADAGYPK